MNVMHLATFEGNIGDALHNFAFQTFLCEAIEKKITYTRTELREFFRNNPKRSFDSGFLDEINSKDLLIIGGGNYFDVRWDYSHTGTTLDFSDEFIEGIRIPVIINAMGYAEPYTTDEVSEEQKRIFAKFERFIRKISGLKNWFVTVRNDGSMERIIERYGKDFASLFLEVPDSGFYFDKNVEPFEFDEKRRTVGISIGNDVFSANEIANNRIQLLNSGIASVVKTLVSQDIRVVFFLHMPRDIEAVYRVMEIGGVESFRKNIVLAPYHLSGVTGTKALISYYKACEAIIAVRFHANIISISNLIPAIGLVVDGIMMGERVINLYRKIELDKYLLRVTENEDEFDGLLTEKLMNLLSKKEECVNLYKAAMGKIMEHRKVYYEALRRFLLN